MESPKLYTYTVCKNNSLRFYELINGKKKAISKAKLIERGVNLNNLIPIEVKQNIQKRNKVILPNNWIVKEDILILNNHLEYKPEYILDLDSTLLKWKRNKEHFEWMYPNVLDIIKKLRFIIISNQSGLKGEQLMKHIKKIEKLRIEIGIEFKALFILKNSNKYRKPSPLITKFFNYENLKIMIGDSHVDLMLILNINTLFTKEIKFKTAINFFTDNKNHNIALPKHPLDIYNGVINNITINNTQKEMIIMIGSPCSTKSTFISNQFKTYSIICQDELGTKKKVLSKLNKELKKGKSVVIDRTNPTKADREGFIRIAKLYHYKWRIIEMVLPRNIINYLNTLRRWFEGKNVPNVALSVYNKKYEPCENSIKINPILKNVKRLWVE